MTEIYARGPVAASLAGKPLRDYEGGIISDMSLKNLKHTHGVSIIGWDIDDESSGSKHWIVRNSWGEYWGELGFFRVLMGYNLLGIESHVGWATPGTFTVKKNVPCHEDGDNCRRKRHGYFSSLHTYVDPWYAGIDRRLRGSS